MPCGIWGTRCFVRVGLGAREAALGAGDPAVRAGLDPSCLSLAASPRGSGFAAIAWIRLRLATDWPGVVLHQIGFAAMGLCFVAQYQNIPRPFGLPLSRRDRVKFS